VTAAGIKVTRHAGVARRKEIVIERNRIRRRKPKNERSKGTRSRDVEELLHLRKKRKTAKSIGGWSRRQQLQLESMVNLDMTFRKTMRLGITKQIAGSHVALQRIKKWTLWRGRPPSKQKKKQH
jgi:hypothetical protein